MTIDTVVLDIEGTICPITFVKNTLYPYFTEKLPGVLESLQFPLEKGTGISDILLQLSPDVYKSRQAIVDHFQYFVDNDIKDPTLKALQGFIWKKGYEDGEITGPIYPDAIKFIKEWTNDSNKIYIYSSGSVKAQKLLFAYVNDNGATVDLNQYLSGYFDITTSGHKTEVQSYENILQSIGKVNAASSVLFLSDNVKEVEAALGAEMKSMIVSRPGNLPLSEEDTAKAQLIHSFDELDI